MNTIHRFLFTSTMTVLALAPALADSIEVAGRTLQWEPAGRLERITSFQEAIGVADAVRGLDGKERAEELVALYGEAWQADVRDTPLGQNTRSAVLAEFLREGKIVSTTGTLLLLHASRDPSEFYNPYIAETIWRGSEDLAPEIEGELMRHWRNGVWHGSREESVSLVALRSLTHRFPERALSLVPEALGRLDSGEFVDSEALVAVILAALPADQALDLIEQRALSAGSEEAVELNRKFLFGLWVLQKEGKLSDPAMRERVWQVYTNALGSESVLIRATALYSVATWHGELARSGETVPVPESFITAVEACNRAPGDEEKTRAEKSLAYWRQHRAAP